MSILHFSSNTHFKEFDPLVFDPILISEFHTETIAAAVFIEFILRTDGTWDTQTSNSLGEKSGTWRIAGGVDTTNYEYRITHAENGPNQGTVSGTIGGIIDGTWTTLASDDGINIQVPDPGPASINTQESDVTLEVREIADPGNTTGQMNVQFTAENDRS